VHPVIASLDLEAFMQAALAEAEAAGKHGEYPIGAVVVIDGAVVSRGRSRNRAARSPLAHAELEALQVGGEALLEHHDRAVLFTTVEPCPLCLGAAVMADVPHIGSLTRTRQFRHGRPSTASPTSGRTSTPT
jgi:tRNA(adenine34) deaminase